MEQPERKFFKISYKHLLSSITNELGWSQPLYGCTEMPDMCAFVVLRRSHTPVAYYFSGTCETEVLESEELAAEKAVDYLVQTKRVVVDDVNLVNKMVPARITILFHPLLTKMARLLQLQPPIYTVSNELENSVTVALKTPLDTLLWAYVGGPAENIEVSAEIAAQRAVKDIMHKYAIIVEDYTSEETKTTAQCGSLYKWKQLLIERSMTNMQTLEFEQIWPQTPTYYKRLCIDNMSVLRQILRDTPIQMEIFETVEIEPSRHMSWASFNERTCQGRPGLILGATCDTAEGARDYVARLAVRALIQTHNVEIIDVNHGSGDAEFAKVVYNLERVSYDALTSAILANPDIVGHSAPSAKQEGLRWEDSLLDMPLVNTWA